MEAKVKIRYRNGDHTQSKLNRQNGVRVNIRRPGARSVSRANRAVQGCRAPRSPTICALQARSVAQPYLAHLRIAQPHGILSRTSGGNQGFGCDAPIGALSALVLIVLLRAPNAQRTLNFVRKGFRKGLAVDSDVSLRHMTYV